MKLNITRIFETSKALATKEGQVLRDFISYVAEALSQIIVALRNGITFEDNFSCIVSTIAVPHNTLQIVNTNGKRPTHILVTHCASVVNPMSAFGWNFNDNGQVQILAQFIGTPTTPINLTLVISF